METQTIQIRGDNDAIAYINFVDRDLAVSIVYGDNQYDFTIEPITLKALAYAYKLHCEECDENTISYESKNKRNRSFNRCNSENKYQCAI